MDAVGALGVGDPARRLHEAVEAAPVRPRPLVAGADGGDGERRAQHRGRSADPDPGELLGSPPSELQTAGSRSGTPEACHYRGRVRLTYFRELMETEFGVARAAAVSRDHVFSELGGRTVEQALEAGIEPRAVWKAVCDAYDVPPARR